MMSKRGGGSPGLFEFLEEADLPQYYHGLRNVLRVYHVPQLKYVVDDDLYSIGMSRPEARRLKACFAKYNPQTYTSKLKKLLLPNTWSKDEFLLDDTNEVDLSPSPNHIQHNTGVKVPRQHIISPEAIKICKELGSGEFGVVEQGVLNDGNRTHQVAIKSLCKDRLHNSMFEFMKEYEIMQSIEHANVVKLFGVVLETSRIMLITELAPLRSLLECLKEPSLRSTLNIVCLSNFGQQICEGMKYLESMRLIHRDLAARNILVFSKNLVKVSDFGLSRALGVGKDYYQTNFNANLKLPIAWCAPECITFLKFTSASDVWAFGVTLWEMFSYGFQPWAAQTGQQILEAIDEPNCLRLEQPLHCPAEHYSIMQQCWRHDPNARPTFAQLVTILEDAKPEQVQAVQSYNCQNDRNSTMLEFDVGTVITVLDKHLSSSIHSSNVLWTGARDDTGTVGLFSPTQTVAYVDMLPSNMAIQNRKWQQESTASECGSTTESVFQRGSSRSLSRSGRKKLSRDMISGPRGEVQHTGHVGIDGIHFGNVAGFFDFKSSSYASMPCLAASGGPSLSLGTAGDSSSELAPLLSGKSQFSSTTSKKSSTFDGHSKSSRNPRLGYTIGYLRNKGPSTSTGACKDGVPASENTKHEYQSISDDGDNKQEEDDDDFFLPPPDLGLSLVDEVMSELSGGGGGEEDGDRKNATKPDHHEESKKSSDLKDLKDLVSSLTISRRQKKKLATVKPIKASDERTLENAIAMANALASKSMHELDKRTTDHFYDSSPAPSPLTPNSPTKRFSFWFPTPGGHHHGSHHRSSSPKERKPFSEEVNANADLESTLSMDEKNAYKALIEGCSAGAGKACDTDFDRYNDNYDDDARYGMDELKRSLAGGGARQGEIDNSAFYVNDVTTSASSFNNGNNNFAAPVNGNNPLPLPPKSVSLYQTNPKRHVRKNPLILPSSRVTNLVSRSESMTMPETPPPVFNLQAPPMKRGGGDTSKRDITTCVVAPISRTPSNGGGSVDRRQTYHFDDAFEDAIASQIDALDDIADDANNVVAKDVVDQSTEWRMSKMLSTQTKVDNAASLPPLSGGKSKDLDEVRIIRKVVGRPVDRSVCVTALTLSRWDIHLAIKIIKLVNLVYEEQGIRLELNQESTLDILQENDWDVSKAADAILHRDQQYF